MRIIRYIARILLGLTFIVSGFSKGIDPWGSAYKITDYFEAMGFLVSPEWTLPLGIFLAFVEFAIGAALLFSVVIRFTSLISLLFMLFFTGLTFWIALENPVTDCGCFGDFLVISNWATFYKNIVLLTFAIIVFGGRKKIKCLLNQKAIQWSLFIVVIGMYIFSVAYSFNHLPIFDFRAYKVGTNIPQAMEIPEGAAQPVFKTTFYYKNLKTGAIEKFTEENYPWQDTLNYAYHDMKSVQIEKGYQPPIHDFSIVNKDGENLNDFYLYDENYVLMLIAYDLKKSSKKNQDKINRLAEWAIGKNYKFIGLTATLVSEEETTRPFDFYNTDEITLKTIIRSNPGLMLIKNGTILKKWHYNDIPTVEEFQKEYF